MKASNHNAHSLYVDLLIVCSSSDIEATIGIECQDVICFQQFQSVDIFLEAHCWPLTTYDLSE